MRDPKTYSGRILRGGCSGAVFASFSSWDIIAYRETIETKGRLSRKTMTASVRLMEIEDKQFEAWN